MKRLQLRKGILAVEFPDNENGMKEAKRFRKESSDFKRGRIRGILQMLPSKVELGKVYQVS